jgi:hypothetical protein
MSQIKYSSISKPELKAELKQYLSFLTHPKHSRSLQLFLLICFNLIAAPAIYAANSEVFSRSQAYAVGLLGIAMVSFSIYLFVVMFQPEKF